MAVYSTKAFADLIGKQKNWLANYIGRGKIQCTGDNIDTDIPINGAFLKKWLGRAEPEIPISPKDDEKIVINDGELDFTKGLSVSSTDDALTRAKKFGELMNKRIDARIKLIEEAKKKGELIPTEYVKSIISTHSRSITTAFQDAGELLIVKISQKKQLTIEDTAALRGEFIEIINSAIDRAIDKSKKSLRQLVKEFSDSKEVGEHG